MSGTPFPFSALPTEVQHLVADEMVDRKRPKTFVDACFTQLPCMFPGGTALGPRHFLNVFFKDEAKVISALHAMNQLFVSQGRVLDRNAQNACPQSLKSRRAWDDVEICEGRQLWYVAYLTHRVDSILTGMQRLIGPELMFTTADRIILLRIVRFLQPQHDKQVRYDYLRSVPKARQQEMDAFLTRITEHIAHKFRSQSTYPQSMLGLNTFSQFFANHLTTPVPGQFSHLAVNSPTDTNMNGDRLVRHGILQVCIKNLLLSLTQDAWHDLFAQPTTHVFNRTSVAATAMAEAADCGVLQIRHGRGSVVVAPDYGSLPASAIHDMEVFVGYNALWAWNQALALPEGQGLAVRGVAWPADQWMGRFEFIPPDDVHPGWPCKTGDVCDGRHLHTSLT